jgi:adenylate kinase family enzyme
MNEYMSKGLFVPDNIMIEAIFKKLQQPEFAGKRILLDGFPRTPKQAKHLSKAFDIDRVVLMQCPDAVCEDRVLQRRVDPVTQEVYDGAQSPHQVTTSPAASLSAPSEKWTPALCAVVFAPTMQVSRVW